MDDHEGEDQSLSFTVCSKQTVLPTSQIHLCHLATVNEKIEWKGPAHQKEKIGFAEKKKTFYQQNWNMTNVCSIIEAELFHVR